MLCGEQIKGAILHHSVDAAHMSPLILAALTSNQNVLLPQSGFSASYLPQRSHMLYTFSPHCHLALLIGSQSCKPNHITRLYHTQ